LQKRGLILAPSLAVVSYVYFTRIVVYLFRSTLSYKYLWMTSLGEEAATMAFYCLVVVRFRPQASNPYLGLAREDDDDIALQP
jgi:hypothetical protein